MECITFSQKQFFIQKKLYVTTQNIKGEISGSHGAECEHGSLPSCCAVWTGRNLLSFQRRFLPPLSGR